MRVDDHRGHAGSSARPGRNRVTTSLLLVIPGSWRDTRPRGAANGGRDGRVQRPAGDTQGVVATRRRPRRWCRGSDHVRDIRRVGRWCRRRGTGSPTLRRAETGSGRLQRRPHRFRAGGPTRPRVCASGRARPVDDHGLQRVWWRHASCRAPPTAVTAVSTGSTPTCVSCKAPGTANAVVLRGACERRLAAGEVEGLVAECGPLAAPTLARCPPGSGPDVVDHRPRTRRQRVVADRVNAVRVVDHGSIPTSGATGPVQRRCDGRSVAERFSRQRKI